MNLARLLAGSVLILAVGVATADPIYPVTPNDQLTPGSLCSRPDEHRYPEGIAYCRRDVASSLKRRVVEVYDATLGYEIGHLPRDQYTLDHYIPLCMGGSNEADNLWPQHRSVGQLTNPLEPKLCRLMSQGRMTQQAAVELIQRAKNFPETAKEIFDSLPQ